RAVVAVRLAAARADPEHEAEDDRDPERDQAGEAEDAVRRRGRPRAPRAAPLRAAFPVARRAPPRLLEEAELVVVVERVHTREPPNPIAAGEDSPMRAPISPRHGRG